MLLCKANFYRGERGITPLKCKSLIGNRPVGTTKVNDHEGIPGADFYDLGMITAT